MARLIHDRHDIYIDMKTALVTSVVDDGILMTKNAAETSEQRAEVM